MKKPNVIIILTDDQGYGDLSCMGSKDFITPNIDALAQRGALLTSMYSNSPVCSPSRAALLTGRYPAAAGVRSILAGHRRATGLPGNIPTIAGALKTQGYNTAAIGKWHLGLSPESRPLNNGFDKFFGFMSGCIDYYSHIFYHGMADGATNPSHDLWEGDEEVHANGEYFTDLITKKAVEYIRDSAREESPFMLYLAYNAPHYPMHAPQKYMDRFSHLPWDKQVMAAMISAVDDGVGAVTNQLIRSGALDNTIIYYQSDNGPSRESRNFMDGSSNNYYGGTAGILKGHKYSLFDGGIRVPGIISWPDIIPAGQSIDQPLAAMDIFPTVLAAAGGEPAEYSLNGHNILPVLTNSAPTPHDDIFWEMGDQTAVRRGRYKLVLNGQLVEDQPAEDAVFLSDMIADPGERNNLAAELPEITAQLMKSAVAWREKLERDWENTHADRYTRLT